jgi:hypothetical protein
MFFTLALGTYRTFQALAVRKMNLRFLLKNDIIALSNFPMSITANISIENNIHRPKPQQKAKCYVVLGKNFLSYVLTSSDTKNIFAIKHFYTKNEVIGKNDFNEIFSESLCNQVTQFYVCIDSPKSTLIPKTLFEKKDAEIFLQAIHPIEAEEQVCVQTLKQEIINLFAIKKATIQFLESKLKQVLFFDANACLLETYPDHILKENPHTLFIACKDESFTLSFYKKNQLILHQLIDDSNEKDVLYYVANATKQFDIPNQTLHIHLHGESPMVETCQKQLATYYTTVRTITRIKEVQYPEMLYAKPTHYFFTLFSFVTCAS